MNFATPEQREAFSKLDNILDYREVQALFPRSDWYLAEMLGFWPSQPVYALDDDGTLLVWFWHHRNQDHLFLYYNDKLESWV
jgi:hypothetical protein